MAQLSKKIELYCEANGVSEVDFLEDDFLALDWDLGLDCLEGIFDNYYCKLMFK